MTRKDLLEALNLFKSRIEKQSIIETNRTLYQHYIKDNVPISIKEIQNEIEPFGFRALSLQVSQVEHYKWVPTDDQDTYIVEIMVGVNNISMSESSIDEQMLLCC